MRHCGALSYSKFNSIPTAKSKCTPCARDAENVCLISPLSLPFSGSLVVGPRSTSLGNPGNILPSVLGIASTYISRNLLSGVEIGLELIRFAVAADDCELFLTELRGKELLFAGRAGLSPTDPKRARVEGVPQRAFVERRCISSRDEPFASCRVPAKASEAEPRSFICVPIPAPDGRTVGIINLTWRRSGVAVETLVDALVGSVPIVGNAICAGYWNLRQAVQEAADSTSETPLVIMLNALREKSGADAGRLVMWDERDHKIERVECFGASPPRCPWLSSPDAAPCSSRNTESCLRLVGVGTAYHYSPEPCRQMDFDGTVCCIPVAGLTNRAGRMLLGFRKEPTLSRVRPLVPLQAMVQEIALHIPKLGRAPAIARARNPQSLEIRCFGHFEVAIGKQKLPDSAFQRRDALTLLKILVLRAGRQVHRSKLIEWLWPETDENVGLNRLHGVVHALRNAIEPTNKQRNNHYLLNEGDSYVFHPQNASIDLISFKEYLDLAAHNLKKDSFLPNGVSHLERAVELYRGDLYENDQGCEWCDIERSALQRELIDALATLARAYLTLGEGKRAMYVLRRALAYDYSREDLQNELVRCLVRFRRHKEASEQISDCVRYLREEMGVEPSAETQRLLHSLVK